MKISKEKIVFMKEFLAYMFFSGFMAVLEAMNLSIYFAFSSLTENNKYALMILVLAPVILLVIVNVCAMYWLFRFVEISKEKIIVNFFHTY